VSGESSLRFPLVNQYDTSTPFDKWQSFVIEDVKMTAPAAADWSKWSGQLHSNWNPGGTQNQVIAFTFTITYHDPETFTGRFSQEYPQPNPTCRNSFIVAGVKVGSE
jgi:hypothetical protein